MAEKESQDQRGAQVAVTATASLPSKVLTPSIRLPASLQPSSQSSRVTSAVNGVRDCLPSRSQPTSFAQANSEARKRALDRRSAEEGMRSRSGSYVEQFTRRALGEMAHDLAPAEKQLNGGGGGNRTHVRKTRPKSVYVCSSRFNFSPERFGRKHSDARASLAKSWSRSARHLTAP